MLEQDVIITTKYGRMPTFAVCPDGQMKKAHQGIAAVEREDLTGPRSIGQVTIGCVLGYLDFRFPDDGWRGRHPKLTAWYQEVEQLPSMQATKPPAG